MIFFQLTVLAAYFGCRCLAQAEARTRNLILAALALSGFLTLTAPLPDLEWLPQELQPLAALMPFAGLAVALFCGTPLLHHQQTDRGDFTIYAWSNAGALAGLVAYPLLVEPNMDLTVQNWVWAAGGSLLPIQPSPAALLGLFLIAGGATMLACHIWLAATRDENTHGFYAATAAGGAIGSALMVLVVPHITNGPVEFPILTLATLAVAGFLWSSQTMRLILSTVAVVGIGYTLAADSSMRAGEVARARTLYGCWRVKKMSGRERYRLINNNTIHGEEDRDDPSAGTTYYGPETGLGKLLEEKQRSGDALDLGVVGLGTGTINRYLRPQDFITYYELDAEAEKLARAWFTYLRHGHSRVILGDGRKSLAAQPGPRFDVLVLDAFAGDAIPTHLLTREAGLVYRRHLKADGALAIHITNRHVDLLPVAQALARSLGLGCDYVKTGTIEWAIVRPGAAPPPAAGLQWTDERNSILPVLRRDPRD